MRFRVESSEGQRIDLDAVDWMMALVRATDLMGTRVHGFSCDTRADGGVDVTDHESGQTWTVTPLPTAPEGAAAAAPADAISYTPGPVGRGARGAARADRSPPPRGRAWRSVPRKPLWSPDHTPRRGPEPSSDLDGPPPNLAERLFELSLEITGSAGNTPATPALRANDACRRTLELVMGLVPGEVGSVLLRDGEHLVFVAATGPAAGALIGRRLPRGEGIAGAAILAGVTIQVKDVAADPRHLADIDLETGFRTRSILCAPIRTETGYFGVIEVLNAPPPGGFLAWHIDVVESLALALAQSLSGT